MDRRCGKCGHDRVVKNGSVHGIPKHQCKACGYQFTKNTVHDYQKYPLRIKLLAVWLYISGLSMRRMSRLCQCSTQSVLNGVRDYAREHDEKPSPAGQAVMLEVDEMWHYLQKKSRKRWIWKALDRDTGQLLDWECEHRDQRTFKNLYKRLRQWKV